ncbi:MULTISPECIES: prolipoprotein diacylglyceryl transferase [unclassified Flavobacterium]|uniref:prolipoprotein diacylglyceryl transferase n=1 Tax=unclassified Flavobacterium TaxID=196869 RepID=UPI00156D616E|nr:MULTISPECIES: prolipoprotein diacylglyceryl transferase family protein [unclassified Flavobacterium]MBE0392100.1 Prolipoprotein diacylglyceryl transferase [Flavobacterium sp. PL002]NRT14550.1 prolipoprotein diacylglyceryltransferase [Flavobacterium sp. 28A]
MNIPFDPIVLGYKINIHLVFEYLAFFIGYRYYLFRRKKTTDSIQTTNRLSIILGATIGAFLGSRIFGFLENPILPTSLPSFIDLLNYKTIMGGLFGGLLGVELAKKIIGEKESSGDLFVFPIILGIFIGRIGCFLSGTNEFTYGKETTFFLGMNLGDGLQRHPLALYELVFLAVLFYFLTVLKRKKLQNGLLFQYFMISYFGFRFFIEFLKPNTFFTFGLSSIQILSIICYIYYYKTILNLFKNAS